MNGDPKRSPGKSVASAPPFWGGRSSAASPPNVDGDSLARMISVGYESNSPLPHRDKLCVLVQEDFFSDLAESFLVAPLLPGCVYETLETLRPDMVLVHRSAFEEGVWFGADRLESGYLVEDIKQIGKWSKAHGTTVIIVDNGKPENYFAGVLEDIGTLFFPNRYFFTRASIEGAKRSLIYELCESYADRDDIGD